MSEPKSHIAFTDVLASCVHDMKNSIAMLLNTIDEITLEESPSLDHVLSKLSHIQYEAKRANSSLIQLLTLYKVDQAQYPLNISYYSVAEFLEEIGLMALDLLAHKGVEVETDCRVDGGWYFDRELVSGVLNNVLNNAFRYAKARIRIAASIENSFLVLSLDDDGAGYPESMLTGRLTDPRSVNFKSGSTGLGLYFSATAAGIHENGGRKGYVSFTNGGSLGGARFELGLP